MLHTKFGRGRAVSVVADAANVHGRNRNGSFAIWLPSNPVENEPTTEHLFHLYQHRCRVLVNPRDTLRWDSLAEPIGGGRVASELPSELIAAAVYRRALPACTVHSRRAPRWKRLRRIQPVPAIVSRSPFSNVCRVTWSRFPRIIGHEDDCATRSRRCRRLHTQFCNDEGYFCLIVDTSPEYTPTWAKPQPESVVWANTGVNVVAQVVGTYHKALPKVADCRSEHVPCRTRRQCARLSRATAAATHSVTFCPLSHTSWNPTDATERSAGAPGFHPAARHAELVGSKRLRSHGHAELFTDSRPMKAAELLGKERGAMLNRDGDDESVTTS